jgi:hypothetical protein
MKEKQNKTKTKQIHDRSRELIPTERLAPMPRQKPEEPWNSFLIRPEKDGVFCSESKAFQIFSDFFAWTLF